MPFSFVTGPFTVVSPPLNVMLPLLSSPVPPVAKMPQPLIWPKLFMGWPPLSNVPPVRLMIPALASNPWVMSSLLPVLARTNPPAGFKSVPPRNSVPPIGSMVPVLVIALPMLPKPWIVPRFVIAPPTRLAVTPFNSIKLLLLNGWLIFKLPLPIAKTPPALLNPVEMVPVPEIVPPTPLVNNPDGAAHGAAGERERTVVGERGTG